MTDKISREEVLAAENTDRELWREPDGGAGDYYADSIFVTGGGGIGINCGGHVIVLPLREWHRQALPHDGGEVDLNASECCQIRRAVAAWMDGRRDAEFWLNHIHVTLGSPSSAALKRATTEQEEG